MMVRVTSTVSDPRARPIGLFDSGAGGLTELHELLVALPQEDFVHLGGLARFSFDEVLHSVGGLA